VLPLRAGLLPAIRAHRRRQLEERLLAGRRWRDSDFVLTTTVGTPLDPNRVRRVLRDVLEAAGLPSITFHDLRHSCASLLAADGVPPRTIMAILGHSDIRLTMNVYAHIDRDAQRDALRRMDALLDLAT
jgi:integrase